MPKTDTITNHAAPGQLAGYLFQPERALFHLAVAGRGSVVGIETLDDVAVVDQRGRVIREQDKHYTSRRAPLSDRSKELWNSLHIWLSAIANEGLDLGKTEFHLVTNRTVSTGLVHDLMGLEGVTTDADWQKFVKKLRDAGTTPTKQLKPLIEGVLGHSDKSLIAFAKRIRVTDGTRGSFGSALRGKIADALPRQHFTMIHRLVQHHLPNILKRFFVRRQWLWRMTPPKRFPLFNESFVESVEIVWRHHSLLGKANGFGDAPIDVINCLNKLLVVVWKAEPKQLFYKDILPIFISILVSHWNFCRSGLAEKLPVTVGKQLAPVALAKILPTEPSWFAVSDE